MSDRTDDAVRWLHLSCLNFRAGRAPNAVFEALIDDLEVIAINSSDEQLRNDFRSKVLKMNKFEEQRYWQKAMDVTQFIEHIELSNRADFNQYFVEHMDFPAEGV